MFGKATAGMAPFLWGIASMALANSLGAAGEAAGQARRHVERATRSALEEVVCHPLVAAMVAARGGLPADRGPLARLSVQVQALPPLGSEAQSGGVGGGEGPGGSVDTFGEESLRAPRGGATAEGAVGEPGAPASSSQMLAAEQRPRPEEQLAPEQAPAYVTSMFQEMDFDEDGVVSREEIRPYLDRLGLPTSDDYVVELVGQFNRGDTEQEGIEWSRFQRYAQKKEKHFRRIFDSMDIGHSGVITQEEMAEVVARLQGQPVSAVDSQKMVKLLDVERNGVITYDEFRRYAILLPAHQLRENSALCIMESAVKPDKAVVAQRQIRYQLMAGGVAGALSKTLVAPLERVRTMMMAEARQAGASASVVGSLRGILREEGVVGLFRGNSATLVKIFPASAIQFCVFDNVKGLLLERRRKLEGPHVVSTNPAEQLLAGSVAGASVCLSTYPLETIKTNMSVKGGIQSGLLRAGLQIVKNEGLKGLYKGFNGAVLNDVLGNGLGFMAYGLGNKMLAKYNGGRRPATWQKGLLGGLSACLVLTVTLPFEVMQKRLQVQGTLGRPVVYKGTLDCFKKICQNEGFGAFYSGAVSSYLKVAPSIACTYFIYELLVRELGIGGLRQYRMRE